jgi:hypothetical protein
VLLDEGYGFNPTLVRLRLYLGGGTRDGGHRR